MNYKEILKKIDLKIEIILNDILNNNMYKSPKAEERLTALCLAREYVKEKISQTLEPPVLTSLLDLEGVPSIEKEVNNEG